MNLFAPFNSDGYKLGHASMYADGTEAVYSNLTPRSDRIYRQKATRFYDGKLVVIGIQGAVMEIVENWQKFFDMQKGIAIARFKMLCDFYLGPDVVSTDNLAALHDLGYLPLEIKAIEEGRKVPMGIPVLTIRNTVKHAYWLVNFLETTISDLTWKPMTNATIAGEYKAMLMHYAKLTGTPVESVAFQAHDFSARGMSGPEDAARSGFGHIAHFLGTDTLGSVLYAMEYYGAKGFVAASVPATEHAVATSNILGLEPHFAQGCVTSPESRLTAEKYFMVDLITRKFPTGIVSYVADSFDFWAVLTKILPQLHDVIVARKSNGITPGKLVIRPDSGDPVTVICGMKPVCGEDRKAIDFESEDDAYDYIEENAYKLGKCDCVKIGGVFYDLNVTFDVDGYYESCGIDTGIVYPYEVVAGAVRTLWRTFGGTVTEKGYKMLNEHIGLIYGDSITPQRCLAILERLEEMGFASGNVVFGVGSYTYQCNTRDTFGFAVKATYTEVGGKAIPIFKDPKTDSKKKSARGLLFVGRNSDGWFLEDNASRELEAAQDNFLKLLFKDGSFVRSTTLDDIRARLEGTY